MKRFIKLSCLLFATLIIVSCSKDDDNEASDNELSNSVEYNDVSYDLSIAIIEDYGSGGANGYYNYDFVLSNTSGNVVFYAELFSKGTETFQTGTFQFVSETTTELPNFYFKYSDFSLDNEELTVKGGNIIVTGSGTDYTVTGELTLNNDEVLKINYSGDFIITDQTDG